MSLDADFVYDGLLPQNCVFDKVLTGCGGSYVALTSPEPYIIAVPTKALVRDKVTSSQYKDYNIQGISEEYPIGKRWLHLYDKIIVTYKSLPALAEKVDISKYHLLVDEMHMLASMSGYAKESLIWIMENFKRFKSYCFMSATVPRSEHMLPELRELPVISMVWTDVARVDFECLVSSDLNSSLLRIMLEHYRGEREGTPYIFYNSVAGICTLIKKWQASDYPITFNVICANTKENARKLKEVKQELGKPNRKADFHFITATAFEGVDFYDPEWYPIIDKLGIKVATTYHKDKTTLKSLYKAALAEESISTYNKISNDFKPGDVYTAAYIKEYLQSLGMTNAKATTLGKWYLLKRTAKEGVTCYRIVQRLTDTLVN